MSSEWFDGSPAELIDGADFFEASATPGTLEIKLRLGSDTVAPFIWPHLADKITVDWTDPNITSCKAYLEGQDGTRVLLNDNEPGVAKYRPSGQTTGYAGSWAQDFGAGVVTDAGIDHAATTGGISAANMVNWELACAFQMLADRTATYLVWVADVDDAALGMTVEAPLFEYTKSVDRKIIWENAHQSAVIHPSGPGVRTGIWNSGTSGTISNPPSLYDGYERPNIVDWMVTANLLVRGVAHDTSITSDLASWFDTYEGQSVGNGRTSSWGFWLPKVDANWHMAIVNGMSEIPPLGFLARKARSAAWEETGTRRQESWIGAQGPDYFVNPSQGVQLRTDDDTTVWTSSGSGVTGWAVTQHEQPVDNTETDFGVWLGDRFAELRPFRGHYSVVPPLGASGGVTYVAGDDLTHYLAYIDADGFVVTERADQTLSWETQMQAFEATWVHYDASRRKPYHVRLCYSDGVKCYTRVSNDGFTFSTAEDRGDGTRMVAVELRSGGHFEYKYDGGDILGRIYDSGGTAIGAEFTAVAGVDDLPFDAFASSHGNNSFRVILVCIVGGNRVQLAAPDGKTFS